MRRFSSLSVAALLLGFLLIPSPVQAQQGIDDLSDLREALRVVSKGYADNYVQPVTDAFGANVNGGLFRTADVGAGFLPLLPFDIYLGVSVSGTLTSSMKKRFTFETETFTSDGRDFTVSIDGNNQVPTAFGQTEPTGADLVVVDEQTGLEVARAKAPQGLVDTPIAPLPVPQLGIGAVAGTDVQVRYFPTATLSAGGGSYGEVGLFGLAVRHDLDQWVPAPLPFNVAVQGAWNQFSLKNDFRGESQEVLDASGWALNLQASRGVPVLPIVLYGGVQYEKFNVDYSYTLDLEQSDVPPVDLRLDQTAANQFRALAGFSLTLAVLRFNVDYAIGSNQNVVTTGLGVRL